MELLSPETLNDVREIRSWNAPSHSMWVIQFFDESGNCMKIHYINEERDVMGVGSRPKVLAIVNFLEAVLRTTFRREETKDSLIFKR